MPVSLHLLMILSLASVSFAVPELTEDQWEQVRAGTKDYSPLVDDAGFYPLLSNAARWQPGDEAGAMVPDYSVLHTSPADHRGQLFLIEGKLVAPPLSVGALSRPGPWDTKLQQWTVQWGPKIDDVAVVYLVAPSWTGRQGQRVRMPARFSRVWRTTDQLTKQPSDFLVFVGHDARALSGRADAVDTSGGSGGSGGGGGASGGAAIAGLVAVLAVLGVGFYVLRRSLARKPLEMQLRLRERREAAARRGEPEEVIGPPLPEDPAEAMRELERRQRQESS